MPTANQISGLKSSCTATGGTTVTIEAGYARDSSDSAWIEVPAGQSRTVNLANNGANGLDTGTVAARTVYALYIVDNGTTVAGIASLSYSAPSGIGSAKFRRIGSIATNSNAKVIAFQQNGTGNDRTVAFNSDSADLVVISDQGAAAFTPFDTSPPASSRLTTAQVYTVPSSGGTTTLKGAGSVETAVTVPMTVNLQLPPASTWGSFKTSTGSTTTLSITGFGETV